MIGQKVLIEIRLFKAQGGDGQFVFWAQTAVGTTCCGRKHDTIASALECFVDRYTNGGLHGSSEPWGNGLETTVSTGEGNGEAN